MKPHTQVPKWLDVTCHQYFWQNEQDLLRATTVMRGWNGNWNEHQHSKLTEYFLPSLLPGIALGTLWSKARRSTIVLSPLPNEWDHHYYIHWQIWRTKEQVISSKTTDSIVIVCKNKEESYSPRRRLPFLHQGQTNSKHSKFPLTFVRTISSEPLNRL